MGYTCRHCGHENRAKAKFCADCGQLLPAEVSTPAASTAQTESAASGGSGQVTLSTPPVTALSAPITEGAAFDQTAAAVSDEEITPLDVETVPLIEQAHEFVQVEQAAEQIPLSVRPSSNEQKTPPDPILTEPSSTGASNDEAGNKGDLAAAALTADEAAVEPSILPALPASTVLADRYVVVDSPEDSAGQLIYRVEDHGVCRSCGVIVQATEEEPYCYHCGAHLLQSTLPWPLYRLREVAADPANAALLTWQTHTFALEPLGETAPAGQVTPVAPPFPQGVNLLVGQRSHTGLGRSGADEDSILTLTWAGVHEAKAQPTLGLYVVADGMGGHGDGEVASRMATETIGEFLLTQLMLPLFQGQVRSSDTILETINSAIQAANRRIHEGALARNNDMGSTLTLALTINEQVYIANVGDSRTYLWGRDGLRQITQDHSHVFTLYKNGALSEEGIYIHPRRNEIYRSLGISHPIAVDHFQEQWRPGDILLLCCDGLWEMLRNEGITDVLMMNLGDPQIICDELVSRANMAGGEDNISVIVVRVLA